jgi:mono/diheme cytochrome c family protein
MSRRSAWAIGGALIGLVALTVAVSAPRAQHQGHGAMAPAAQGGAAPRTVTMEELHRQGGVPRGWKFALPAGDPVRGKQLFADLECYKCHAIQGESVPAAGGDAKNVGPELTGMGGMHPAEYFAESILSPNAVILDGPGYTGPDGKSIMPSYADSLSVNQLVDLVAFLKGLTGGGHDHGAPPVEKTAGEYAIRLEYRSGDGHGAHSGRAGHAAPAAPGHLMVFVSDRVSGEPVPYLPVTATIRAPGKPARAVKLSPMVGGQGFHYGATVTLPEGAHTITLTIGPAAMQVRASAKDRFAKPVTVVFERPART